MIKKILEDWNNRVGGNLNHKKESHLFELGSMLWEQGWSSEQIGELIKNLVEQETQFKGRTKKGDLRYFKSKDSLDKALEKGTVEPVEEPDKKDDEPQQDPTKLSGPKDFERPSSDTQDGEQTTTTSTQDLNSLTKQRDKIFTGETTPPGTGGSAVMETIGGEYSEQLANGEYQDETEDEFVNRQMKDRGDKPPLNTLSEKEQKKWLKISYKKGKNDIESLKGNPEHDYGEQPPGFPKAASGDADTAEPVLAALEKQLANAKSEEDKKHYENQIEKFKERVRQPGEIASGEKDSDSLLIYYDSKNRLRVHHISDKSSLNDTFMNKTIKTKSVSHKKASQTVGKDMNLSNEEIEQISLSISSKEEEVGEDVKNTSKLPHKTLKDKSDDDINEGVEKGIGGIMGNLGSGQRGRRDYTNKINSEIKNAKTSRSAGAALKNQLDKMGAEPDENGNYSNSDIAKAILAEVRDNPNSSWRKYVDKMGTSILDTRAVAKIVEREVRKKADKENPKPTEEEIEKRINQETAERMSGQGKSGRKLDSSEPAKPITAEDVAYMRQEGGMADELSDMSRSMKDAMGAAHRKIKEHILEEDKKLGFPDENGDNGPHSQTYIESFMNDMHFYRHFDGPPWEEDGDDNGDEDGSINVGGKNLKSKAIVNCIKEQTDYDGPVETKEDKQKFWLYLRKKLRIESESDSVTIDSEDGTKQVGRQNYRSAGSGVQKVTGNFGTDVQECAKKKLAESGQV